MNLILRNFILLSFLLFSHFACQNETTQTNDKATTTPVIESNKSNPNKEPQTIEYETLKLEGSNIEIQKPKKWLYERLVNGNGITYYVTPSQMENLVSSSHSESEDKNKKDQGSKNTKEKVFKNGFSLVFISGVKRELGFYPSEQAEKFINNAKKINPKLNVKSILKDGLNCSSFRIEENSHLPNSYLSNIFLIADDANDLLHTFVFQYTQAEKDLLGPIGSHILKNIKVTRESF